MRHKILRIVFMAAALSLITSLTMLPVSRAGHPYNEKLALKALVPQIVTAILEEDVDTLDEITVLTESFHFDKKDKVKKFLGNYFDVIVETREIEILDIELKNDREAEAMVRVHTFDRREDIPGMDLKPRDETWQFVKGKTGKTRDKWLFVLE